MTVFAVLVLSCGPSAPADTTATGTGSNPDGDPRDSGTAAHPPGLEIAELSVTPATITVGGEVRVRARLIDPDGLDDIVSTFILGERGEVVTALGATPDFGIYEARISWAMLGDEDHPISFVGQEERTLRVRVVDGVGNQDERTVVLRLQCGDGSPAHGACDGQCFELDNDRDHCGACNNACGSDADFPRADGCEAGRCFAPTECKPLPTTRTCAQECASRGKTCANACFHLNGTIAGGLSGSQLYCENGGWWYLVDFVRCDEPTGDVVRCCCSE